jgi:hypothetical protein
LSEDVIVFVAVAGRGVGTAVEGMVADAAGISVIVGVATTIASRGGDCPPMNSSTPTMITAVIITLTAMTR